MFRFVRAALVLVASAGVHAGAQQAPVPVAVRFNIFNLSPAGELTQADVDDFSRAVRDAVSTDSLARIITSNAARYRLDASIQRNATHFWFRFAVTDIQNGEVIARRSVKDAPRETAFRAAFDSALVTVRAIPK